MSTRTIALIAVLAVSSASAVALAQGKSQGRGRGSAQQTTASAVVVFNDADRVTFRDYFLSHKIVAQPLPPGIAKNVARGKPLPPGIAKRAVPADLVLALGPRVQPGVTFSIVGDRVVALRGGLVIDVMINVFR